MAPFPTYAQPQPLDFLLQHINKGCYRSLDDQGREILSFEDAARWIGDSKIYDDSPSDSRSFSHPRSGTAEGAFEVPPSGWIDGILASETLDLQSTNGHDIPPLDDAPPLSDVPSLDGVSPIDDVHLLDDIPPSPDGGVYNDTEIPSWSDDDIPNDAPLAVGAALFGNADNYMQRNHNGIWSCTWITEPDVQCEHISTRVLVKRHIRRVHFQER